MPRKLVLTPGRLSLSKSRKTGYLHGVRTMAYGQIMSVDKVMAFLIVFGLLLWRESYIMKYMRLF